MQLSVFYFWGHRRHHRSVHLVEMVQMQTQLQMLTLRSRMDSWKQLLQRQRREASLAGYGRHESGQAFQDHFQTWLSFKPSSWYTSPIKCQWPALSGHFHQSKLIKLKKVPRNFSVADIQFYKKSWKTTSRAESNPTPFNRK
ncbi:uncharacterized protein J5F26_001574 isoform 1-T1 [Ciconia maguari]